MQIGGISETQTIYICDETDREKLYTIDITMMPNDPTFFVHSSVDSKWIWEFHCTGKTDYERVKQCIMDMVCMYDDIFMVLNMLSDSFLECFADMLILEDDCNSYLN